MTDPAPPPTRARLAQSRRLAAVQDPVIPIVGQLTRDNPGTISLGQGVVHYAPPDAAIERARAVAAGGLEHKYQLVGGIPELLDAIEAKLKADNVIAITPDRRVIVTAGGNMAFNNALLAIADPGDEVILLGPYYFNHEMAITIADCTPVIVPTDERFQPDVAAIEAAITPRTRAIVTVTPNNPTGAVYEPDRLRAINRLCAERDLYHICDEPYEYFIYGDAEHFSPASLPGSQRHTIALYSLSKAYGFASWRMGYMVIPDHLEMAIKKIQDTILICPPVLNQHAAAAALGAGKPWCDERIATIAEVRDLALDRLGGLTCLTTPPRSDGAFYVVLNLDTARPDMAIIERLVREFGVAALPGSTFGIHDRTALRIAYGALQKDTVAEGLGRLIRGLDAILAG